ncbi:uncharacterized transmembrane protein DDB_G0289901-like [Penaeus japonicus]|uniref:uncharacterized transmembrane protein DDB_G0289901-like n=1 Tax=Penaeus japonicus TaxID=27405 RepID=UPI001C70B80F|nr:uncharacterized transmembrane protein DDB_G0289901-like [Penaeus japonicus]
MRNFITENFHRVTAHFSIIYLHKETKNLYRENQYFLSLHQTSVAADRSDAVTENFHQSSSQRENLIEEDDDGDQWTSQSSTTTFRDEDNYDSREDDLEQSSSSSVSSTSSSSSSRGYGTQSTTNKFQAFGTDGEGSARPPYVAPETPSGHTDRRGKSTTERGRYTSSGEYRGHHGGRGGHHRSESTTSTWSSSDGRGWDSSTAGNRGTGSGWGGTNRGNGGTGSGWGGANRGNGGTGSGWGGANRGSGGTGSGWGGANGGNGGTGSGWGGANGGNGGTGSGWGGANGGSSGGTGCRGVPPGSPNWVPGLDQWCVQNCAAGYCPEAQCVC